MNRTDRLRWASARTVADLGDLMALWLEGDIKSRPGYKANCGPADETTNLIPVLAACNRAGYITDGSQPGFAGPGYDGAHWTQHAAVMGFASPEVTARLRTAEAAGLTVLVQEASWRLSWRHAIPVTYREGCEHTWFGTRLSRCHISDSWTGYGMCSTTATDALCAAYQVTVVDPVAGRNDRLWPALATFAAYVPAEAS